MTAGDGAGDGGGGGGGAHALTLLEHAVAAAAGSRAFSEEVGADLGRGGYRRLVDLSQEGLWTALRGVRAPAAAGTSEGDSGGGNGRQLPFVPGGLPVAASVVFEGLRMARRGATLTLMDAQDATMLTATGLSTLQDLSAQIDTCIGMAQRHFGSAVCLREAVGALQCSGLVGMEGLVLSLETAAAAAAGIGLGLEDPASVVVAARMRELEAQVQPLLLVGRPNTSGFDNDDVLWETRMVNVGDIVMQALRDVRAEVGGWAICADVAAVLSAYDDPDAATAADGFAAASKMLHEQGAQRGGADSLHAVRGAQMLGEARHKEGDGSPKWLALVFSSSTRLRESVGAAAVLREASQHRIPACEVDVGRAEAEAAVRQAKSAVQQALQSAASLLQQEDREAVRRPIAESMLHFLRACELAREHESLKQVLNEVDREVSHLLGAAWRPESTSSSPAPEPNSCMIPEDVVTLRGHDVRCCVVT
mmetsp:Transcript_82760/g.210580  ORF Transcript_82760/g.210580 Transcript_82760/m.210580 type:complete len:478 (+) Transcript_82760:153-1586(+)